MQVIASRPNPSCLKQEVQTLAVKAGDTALKSVILCCSEHPRREDLPDCCHPETASGRATVQQHSEWATGLTDLQGRLIKAREGQSGSRRLKLGGSQGVVHAISSCTRSAVTSNTCIAIMTSCLKCPVCTRPQMTLLLACVGDQMLRGGSTCELASVESFQARPEGVVKGNR